ncbi:hypothetical protein ACOJBO_07625 [Rhizobium beringeri]
MSEQTAESLSEAHVRSGKVMTVTGPISADALGVTLMHEHILNDCRCWWHAPKTPERQYLAESFVCMEILGELEAGSLRQQAQYHARRRTSGGWPNSRTSLRRAGAPWWNRLARASAVIRWRCSASRKHPVSTS